jgi:hypothetical protein
MTGRIKMRKRYYRRPKKRLTRKTQNARFVYMTPKAPLRVGCDHVCDHCNGPGIGPPEVRRGWTNPGVGGAFMFIPGPKDVGMGICIPGTIVTGRVEWEFCRCMGGGGGGYRAWPP